MPGPYTLTDVPPTFEAPQVITDFQVDLTGISTPNGAKGLTVGEDGDLYVVDDGTSPKTVVIFSRRRDGSLNIIIPDCENAAEANCTTFESSPSGSGWDMPSANVLDAIFTVPGLNLVGIFNEPTSATSYDGTDESGSPITTSQYFRLYDPMLLNEVPPIDPPIRGTSGLPGELFSLGSTGLSYADNQPAQAAETASDGGYFIVCPNTNSAPCQMFARTCFENVDCQDISGLECNADATTPFCFRKARAIDDHYEVDPSTTGNTLNVTANDVLSESACVDPVIRIVSVDTTGMLGTIVGFTPGDTDLTYDAPINCGETDTFTYTADLGGGVLDDATVYVVIACECGNEIVEGNEQCDNGDGGTTEPNNGPPPARCSDECTFNVICGDGFVDPGEECDDGVAQDPPVSGDGCSALCTLEGLCGNGTKEGLEECDDGNTVSGDNCNANCTLPVCGDGRLDTQKGEECDDGNTTSGDGCSSTCKREHIIF